jgi:hypothetical protein
MAALTASQASDALSADSGRAEEPPERAAAVRAEEPAVPDARADGELPYHTDLPPLDTVGPGEGGQGGGAVTGDAQAGIPATVLDAYRDAEAALGRLQPGCHLRWEVLAAIGKVESGHARGGDVSADGTTVTPILGPVLNGVGFANIPDTDGGAFDSDARYDRAVGPMQFIPSTWARWGRDGNGDGRSDPNNVYDAALAAGEYLCASGRNLAVAADLDRALLSYNHSWDYVRTVRSWLDFYDRGVHEVPDGEGPLPQSPGAGNPGGDRTRDEPDRGAQGAGGNGNGSGNGNGGANEDDGQNGGSATPSPRPPADVDGGIELPEEPEEPEEPEKPEEPEEPEEPQDPDEGDPGEEEPGGGEEDPEDPQCPVDPEDPGTVDPEDPGTEDPEEPGTEEPAPADPAQPPATEDPEDPADPENPADPEEPGTPEEPDGCPDPDNPDDPDNPEEPGTGEDGEGEQSPEPTPTETAAATLRRVV